MIAAIFLTIIPAILAYILISKLKISIKSGLFKASLSWFLGQYIFTILAFLICLILIPFTKEVLFKSVIITSLVMILLLSIQYRYLVRFFDSFIVSGKIKSFLKPSNILIVVFCFAFSYFFFSPHLSYQNNEILRSPIYWDYPWQMSLNQNFVYGDNFPPENEAFAGIPANYHYFWMVNASIYQTMGLNLVDAINFASIIQFFFLLLTLIGVSVELFRSRLVGFLAVFLSITSSSFHFLDYFIRINKDPFLITLKNIFTTAEHPWSVPFIRDFYPFVYNGTFYNLFYLIEERQMIPAIIFLLITVWLLSERNQFTGFKLSVLGFFIGIFFLWHLHVTLILLLAIIFTLIFGSERKKTLYLLIGFLISFIPHFLFFRLLAHSEWFIPQTTQFPKFNFGFSDQEGKVFSLLHALSWYTYSYGLKIILLPLSLILLFKKHKGIALSIAAVIIPTFILLNSVQLSPNSIYENHKFLRPMNFVVDLAIAFIVYFLFFKRKKVVSLIIGILLMISLTASGVIEHMPFINSNPTVLIANYPSRLTNDIRKNSEPKSVFIGTDNTAIYLAGRKLFLADNLRGHDEESLNKQKRKTIIEDIYNSADLENFCLLTNRYNIDFIEYNKHKISPEYLKHAVYFITLNSSKEPIIFVNTERTCEN